MKFLDPLDFLGLPVLVKEFQISIHSTLGEMDT